MEITTSVIKESCMGPVFRTESYSILIPWIHLLNINLLAHGNSSLVFQFSSHIVTINAPSEVLEYALECCQKGEFAGFRTNQNIKISIEECQKAEPFDS